MNISQDIFRAYDIRGVYGEELDANIGERVGLAFGNFLAKNNDKGKVSIGCDARVSSPELQEAVATGISKAGFDVDIIGMVPIPVANFTTWKANSTSNPYLGGVYITASHNPAEYNGIRFRHPDGTGYTEGNLEIKRIFFEDKFPNFCLVNEIICSNCLVLTFSTAFRSVGFTPEIFAKLINAFMSFGRQEPP